MEYWSISPCVYLFFVLMHPVANSFDAWVPYRRAVLILSLGPAVHDTYARSLLSKLSVHLQAVSSRLITTSQSIQIPQTPKPHQQTSSQPQPSQSALRANR